MSLQDAILEGMNDYENQPVKTNTLDEMIKFAVARYIWDSFKPLENEIETLNVLFKITK